MPPFVNIDDTLIGSLLKGGVDVARERERGKRATRTATEIEKIQMAIFSILVLLCAFASRQVFKIYFEFNLLVQTDPRTVFITFLHYKTGIKKFDNSKEPPSP